MWVTGGPVGIADRSALLTRQRRGELPAYLASVVEMSRAEGERRALRRGRVAPLVLGVLSEWGFATALQMAEMVGVRARDVRAACFDMLAAGWLSYGKAGYYHDRWSVSEFWSLAATQSVEWLFDRWSAATIVEVFAGRPIGTVTKAGAHRARHDLFTLDLALDIAARSPHVATIAGAGSALPAKVLGVDDERRAIADMLIVRDDGHLIFVEAGLVDDGGERRMRFYLDLAAARGTDAFTVVFVDIHHPYERRDRNHPERTLAAALAQDPSATALSVFAFAEQSDWRAGSRYRERLPVRVPADRAVKTFHEVELLDPAGSGGVPGWAVAHRQLATSSFLLARAGDAPLVWHDWLVTARAGDVTG